MALWTPASLSNTKIWFVSDNPANVLVGGQLSTIADKGGGGFNATPDAGAAGNRAALTGTLNSRTIWSSDSTTLKGAFTLAGANAVFNNLPGVTLVAVHRMNPAPALGDNVLVFASRNGNPNSARATLQRYNTATGDTTMGGRRLDSDGYAQTVDTTNAGTAWTISISVLDEPNALASISTNGTLTTPTAFQTAGNGSATDSSQVSVGHYAGGAGGAYGDYAEVLFIVGVLSTSNRQRLEGYLAWQWALQSSLPAGHPYKAAAPEDPQPINAAPAALAAATGALTTQKRLNATPAARATATGALTTQKRLNATPAAVATATGTLAGGAAAAALTASPAAIATATGALSTQKLLAGSAQAAATATGTLGTPAAALTGAAQAVATATGALTTQKLLAGSAIATATASGTLQANAPTPTPDTGTGGGPDPEEARRPLPISTQGLQIRRAPRIVQTEEASPAPRANDVPAVSENQTQFEALGLFQLLELEARQLATQEQAEREAAEAARVQAQQQENEWRAQLLLVALVEEQQRRREQDEIALLLLMAD